MKGSILLKRDFWFGVFFLFGIVALYIVCTAYAQEVAWYWLFVVLPGIYLIFQFYYYFFRRGSKVEYPLPEGKDPEECRRGIMKELLDDLKTKKGGGIK